ncbi:hypothetical protein EPUS_05007 [Endocarpon pusillum Z07020]|uniref:Protein kinase domain-containing protein n=1 Tax=Endocarpon pusillum (strain Z07020 / HMAS-L-300199) TaxID=1263415 RepID=U1HSD6_ENDPU|nr:uncharacterized protein EPUS_05007 [Endocarpon pusillum Z07020]ERF72089.1 hypothetical protein EPUS_05007 [Endocarpon pusillum Z07020]
MSAENKPELKLYYLRPGFELIEPHEVEKRQEALSSIKPEERPLFFNYTWKLSPTLAVKHGERVTFREAQNMFFIEQNTTIPVPKVYAVYSHPMPNRLDYTEDDEKTYYEHTYIFMDLLPGATVEKSWDQWDQATRLNVQNELKTYVEELRRLPGGHYIGSLNHGPVTDWLLENKADNYGPFNSEEEFNLELRKAFFKVHPEDCVVADRLDGILAAHKHKIKFTHNDLKPSNILIKDGHISGIIDWGLAGWYPDYWEYGSATRIRTSRQDWNIILDRAIGRPHCEVHMLDQLVDMLLF